MRYQCPCCGYYTFQEPLSGNYNICPVCFWEDDPVQLEEETYEGGANSVSLQQARENYRKFGASDLKMLAHVRKPLKEEVELFEE